MAELDITDLRAWLLREPVSRRAYTAVQLSTKSGLTCSLTAVTSICFLSQTVLFVFG